MTKLPITKKSLIKEYKKEINHILDECDWISHIEDWRMVSVIVDVCKKKGLIIDGELILNQYQEKVKYLNLTTQEWQDQYGDWDTGLPKIIDMIYDIIENKFCGVK